MSIEAAESFIERIKNDKEFLAKVLRCASSKDRMKLIETENCKFSVMDIINELKSGKYMNAERQYLNNRKWLEIVGVWCVDRRMGWRRDKVDKAARSFLSTKKIDIFCPSCNQKYSFLDDSSNNSFEFECDVCNETFTVELSGKSDDAIISEDNIEKKELTDSLKIPKDNLWKNWK